MALTSGARLGTYEVIGALGAGGMGEVYRARDTQLNRDVAIKVLPELFALDAGPPRPLHARSADARRAEPSQHRADLWTAKGRLPGHRALVMELVDGEDLSSIIARGPMPLADALADRAPDRRSARGCPRSRASSIAISSRRTSKCGPTAP